VTIAAGDHWSAQVGNTLYVGADSPGTKPWPGDYCEPVAQEVTLYLMQYSALPLDVDVGGDAETIANANINSLMWAAASGGGTFWMRLVPDGWDSTDGSNHAIWTIDSNNRLFWRGSSTQFNFRADGSHQGFPNVSFADGDDIWLAWDFGTDELEIYINSVASGSPNSFSNDWSAQSSADIEVGADGGGSPAEADLYWPIAGVPA